jgi:hypothetical protein
MPDSTIADSPSRPKANRATLIVTLTVVALLAFAGFEHGLFAALQGNRPTGAPAGIQAIGDDIKWWKYGGEDAFTLIPTFLLTGVAAMAVSIFIFLWAAFFLTAKRGVLVLLALFILLVLVGGGIGFIPFFLVTCAYATRLTKPLRWWRKKLSPGARRFLAPLWPWALGFAVVCWLIGIAIAVFGYVPGLSDPEAIISFCWSFLLATMVFINVSYVCAFAADIESFS